jgi:hypothetical protein
MYLFRLILFGLHSLNFSFWCIDIQVASLQSDLADCQRNLDHRTQELMQEKVLNQSLNLAWKKQALEEDSVTRSSASIKSSTQNEEVALLLKR